MTVRIGFVGAGFITDVHRWFLSGADVDHEISAVHDTDPARADAFATGTGARVCATDEELCELVDAVYVTTWTSEHAPTVRVAADAGVAVFCEKPLAFDATTAEEMARTVEEAGVTNQVGLVLRFAPPFRLVRHLLADPRAGRVMAAVFRDDQFIPIRGAYGSDWRADPGRAGRGALLEHSIHDVDLLGWLLGPIRSVSGRTREVHGIGGIEDVAAVGLEFTSGATAQLTSIWHDIDERPSLRRVEIFCERLWVAVEGDVFGPVRWRFAGDEEQVVEGAALVRWLHDRGDVTDNPAREFLAAVRAGGRAEPDLRAALPAHRAVDAAYASAARGGVPVELGPA